MSGDTRRLTAEQAAIVADWYAFSKNYIAKISRKGQWVRNDQFDDLVVDAAVNGLIGAVRSFNKKKNVPWPVYLTRRLRGARIDYIRDHIYQDRRIGPAVTVIPMAFEDLDYIGAGLAGLWEVDTDPKVSFKLLELRGRLDAALKPFPVKKQKVIRELFKDRTQAEVARDFGVTDSRVCQIWREFEKSIAC